MDGEQKPFLAELQMGVNVIHHVLHFFSITVEVFLRRKFGERYFDSITFSMGFFLIMVYSTAHAPIVFFTNSGRRGSDGDTKTLVIAGIAFLLASLWHKYSMRKIRKAGERWHSYCSGISWGFWNIFRCSLATVQMYLEPLLCVAISFAVSSFSKSLSTWLFIAGFSLFLRGQVSYMQARKRFLDAMDAQIEAEQMNAVLVDARPPGETEGFAVYGAESQPVEQRENLANHFKRLDKGLKDIMDSN